MANAGGIITAPVDIRRDIAAVLGANTGNLASLCTNAGINQWSRVKPIHNPSRGVAPAEVDAFMKANNFGFMAAEGRGLFGTGLADFMLYGRNDPEYAKPDYEQGSLAPCRVLDFNGYNHNVRAEFPICTDFIYVNTAQDPDKLYVQFKVNENTPIQMREFTEILPYAPGYDGGWRYVVVIDKTGGQGMVPADFDVKIGHEVFNSAALDYYHMQSPIANEIMEINMSSYPASTRVVAGMMRITYSATGVSYGRTMVIWNGGYTYQRTSPVAVNLQPIYRGFGEDAQGISELRFSLQITGTGTFRDFNIIANFYHNETDTQEFYNAGAYIANPTAGSYAVMDVSGAPTRVQFSDYATMRYYYREDGQLHDYYFDFRNALVSSSPYPKQKLL